MDPIPAMTEAVNILQYMFPVIVLAVAGILFCFYIHAKKKRAEFNVAILMQDDINSSSPISLSEDQAEVDTRYDSDPPRYSTVDFPPPYSLFDPRLTGVCPSSPPPAYDMYPIMLPLAPHYWTTPTGRHQPTPSSSCNNSTHPNPQRSHRLHST